MTPINRSRDNTNVDLAVFDELIRAKTPKAQIARQLGISRTTVYRLTGNIKYVEYKKKG